MNTTKLKRFATDARTKVKQGVTLMIRQWGFDANGNILEEAKLLQGGTMFRDQIFDGEDTYYRWDALKTKIQHSGLRNVYEEAAYTWFNRFVAIKILSKNNLLEPYLDYVEGDGKPTLEIIAQARRGILPQMSESTRRRILSMVDDHNREAELLTLLITAVCHNTPILANCFGKINDYTELLLPRTVTSQGDFLDMLNDDNYITEDDYRQPELIGWLYQFYISERKDEVFASFKTGNKASKDDIPAATQIFTPNWIVKYMVQNTVGRIYLDNNPYSQLSDNWKYLVQPAEGNNTDANKLKIENPEELTIIDAACGSGHILVEAFDTLYSIYLEQYASPREACDSILKHNIVGIDIDTRAKQLAQFALLMKACNYVPEMADCHQMPLVFDMPEPISESEFDNLRDTLPHFFLGGNKKVIDETIEAVELLQQAQVLGSIMKFSISDATRYAIQTALENHPEGMFSFYPHLKLMLALTEKYAAVVMNPPYMGSGNMNSELSKYVKDNYEEGKADLFSVFMILATYLLKERGKYGMINMQSWMFLSSFEKLRTNLLQSYSIDNMLHLGPRTFDELSGEVVQNTSFVITKTIPSSDTCGTYYRLVFGANCHTKESMFLDQEEIDTEFADSRQVMYPNVLQQNFAKIPGCPIGYWVSEKVIETFTSNVPLSAVAKPCVGLQTADNGTFLRQWFEVNQSRIGFGYENAALAARSQKKWFPYNKGGAFRKWYGNQTNVVNWENDGKAIKEFKGSVVRNPDTYFNSSISWSKISAGKIAFRLFPSGFIYDVAGTSLFPKDKQQFNYIIGLVNSNSIMYILQLLSPTLNFEVGQIATLPTPIINNSNIDYTAQRNINISKQDWDSHETSWDFEQNELISLNNEEAYIQVMQEYANFNGVMIDLAAPELGKLEWGMQNYKTKWETKFYQLQKNEEELNRQFIEIYGLQNELTPDVPLDEITILQQGEISIENNEIIWHNDVIIKQLISYAVGVWMGRYRLDKTGLHIAHPDASEEEIAVYTYNGAAVQIDDDGIIPILPEDSPFTDNLRNRIIDFISIVFGQENQVDNLNYIERSLGKSLSDYLVKDFWKDHKKMYQNRPIYWLFSSKKGAFQCITYMHRMDEYTLERVRQKYLLPYISFLDEKISAIQSRDTLTTAESRQLSKLQTILDECREYHDRLHQYSQKNISFDLDDGVVKNYALFGDVLSKLK